MLLTIKDKEYKLRLLCGRFRELKERIGGDNLMESISQAMQDADADVMAAVLAALCWSEKLTKEEALHILDGYLEEGHTVMDFGMLALEVLDESGFLPKKGMAKTLTSQMDRAMATLDEQLERLTPEAVFAGFKA